MVFSRVTWCLLVLFAWLVSGCSLTKPGALEWELEPSLDEAAEGLSASGFEGWSHKGLPGKRSTRYQLTQLDGRWAVVADARSAVSLFRRSVRLEPEELGSIEFAWRVQALLDTADLTSPGSEDSPVRLLLAFEGDRSKFSNRNRMLSDLVHALTGEPLPYATLMYVWDNAAPVGSIIPSGSGTDRIRKLVLDSGPTHVKTWRKHARDIVQDYQLAFGEEPGPLVGLALMTDSDNTRTRARAWYGEIRLLDKSGQIR